MKFAPVLALGLALTGCIATSLAGDSEHNSTKSRDNKTTTLFRLMGKNTIWTPVKSVTVNWQTFHTQGLVKIDDTFYVSAVEVLEGTVRNGTATDSLYDFSIDRSAGNGRGWLFKFNEAGELLGKVELTEGSKYHPGGIDFDGKYIWVPVAEYRPNSASNIFRVDPKTLQAEKIFSESDHIGGIVHNTHDNTLHGVSWGSRRLYSWELSKRGKVTSADWVPNPQWYIDYQDCHYQGVAYMLCGGVQTYTSPKGNIALGGLELLDLRRNRLEHQIPVNLFTDEGAGPTGTLALTHNAFWVEPSGNGSMRGYFMTETNNQAALVVYDMTPWISRP